ncbi:hypothetical protein HZA55_07300 [Candidatus Poribacteria bacterium]|nr:hypothetical protein [Candidatus Poribacteria bacterium]
MPILVFINTVIIITFVMWNPIKNHFKKIYVLGHANIDNTIEVYSYCDLSSLESKKHEEAWIKCLEGKNKFEFLKKRFDSLIKKEANLKCSDFINKTEARQFYEYVGGINLFNQLKITQENSDGVLNLMLRDNVSQYDPYNLDSNYNGIPCESLSK